MYLGTIKSFLLTLTLSLSLPGLNSSLTLNQINHNTTEEPSLNYSTSTAEDFDISILDSKNIDTVNTATGALNNVSTFDIAQVGNLLDNFTVDEVGSWSGWIRATILMNAFWIVYGIKFAIIWIIWYFYVYGDAAESLSSLFNFKSKKKKPSYGNMDSYFPFLKTYTSSRRSSAGPGLGLSPSPNFDPDVIENLLGVLDSLDSSLNFIERKVFKPAS